MSGVEEGVVSDEAAEGDARRGGMGEVRRGRGGDAEEHLLEELAVHGIEAWGGPGPGDAMADADGREERESWTLGRQTLVMGCSCRVERSGFGLRGGVDALR